GPKRQVHVAPPEATDGALGAVRAELGRPGSLVPAAGVGRSLGAGAHPEALPLATRYRSWGAGNRRFERGVRLSPGRRTPPRTAPRLSGASLQGGGHLEVEASG